MMNLQNIISSILLHFCVIAGLYTIYKLTKNLQSLTAQLTKLGLVEERRKYNGMATTKIMIWIVVANTLGNTLGLINITTGFNVPWYIWAGVTLASTWAFGCILYLFYKQSKAGHNGR